MIYLASPYTHFDYRVQQWRYRAVLRKSAEMIADGEMVFSPIVYGHPFVELGIAGDWETWSKFDARFKNIVTEFAIYMLPGWHESKGIAQEEILFRGVPFRWIEYEGPEMDLDAFDGTPETAFCNLAQARRAGDLGDVVRFTDELNWQGYEVEFCERARR